MTHRQRFWLVLCAWVAGGLAVIVLASLLIIQTQWFGNFAKEKVIAALEDSVGGRAEIGSVQIDPWSLTVRVRNVILHGTEPSSAAPLAQIPLLELRLKLFTGIKHTVDLAYLGVSSPKVNLIVNPDGTTNIPTPKVKQAPSNTSGLQTVVDLAIGQFRIDNGLLAFSQEKSQFSAQGENLQALLNFNSFNSTYVGNLKIDPLLLSLGKGTPLPVHVNLPVLLEKDAVSISGGTLATAASQISINAGLRDLNAPKISARMNANLALAEMQKAFNLPLDLTARDVPKTLTADLTALYDQNAGSIQIQNANLDLGQTTFRASGTMQPTGNQAVQFNGKLALTQLSQLLKLGTTQMSGALLLNGTARMGVNNNYSVNGNINSQALGIRSGDVRLNDVSLSGPFHVDPYLISADGLKLDILGGNLSAKIFLEKMQNLSVEGRLRNFAIPALARAFAGHPLGYDGSISGLLLAKDDLKAHGTTGASAQAHLEISPGSNGVPVSGHIDGRFNGESGLVDLQQSYLALPNTRLDLAGNINNQLNIALVSHNLNDFLPAANFGAPKPITAMPVTLQGGTARVTAQIIGSLSTPDIQAHASVDRFAVEGSPIQHAALDLAASPSGAAIRNGVLTSKGINSTFDASIGLNKWKPLPQSPLNANLSLPNGNLADILLVAGQKNVPASGNVNAQVHINGTYGDPLGNASLQVTKGVAYDQPFDKVQMNVDLTHDLISLSNLELDAAGGQLVANGTFRHPSDSFEVGQAQFHLAGNNIQLASVQPLQQRSPGTAGLLKLVADGAGSLRKSANGTEFQISNLSSDFSADALKVNNQAAGNLTAQARTVNGAVNYNIHSDFAGSAIQVDGKTSLSKDYPTKASASIQNLSIEKALAIAGQAAIPATGTLSANANVSGTLDNPDANLNLTLSRAVLYSEPLNQFSTKVHYSNTQINIPSLSVDVPAGTLNASADYVHKSGDLNSGHMQLRLNSSDIDLSKIKHITQAESGVGGSLKLMADLAGDIRESHGKPELLLTAASADINAQALRANNQDLGQLRLTAQTRQQTVDYVLSSSLAKAKFNGSGSTQLSGEYPTHAKLTFANIRYTNIAPFLPSDNPAKPAFDAFVEGQASVDGPVLKANALSARLQLNQVVLNTTAASSATGGPGSRKVQLQNEGPLILALDHSVVKVQQFRIQGVKTYFQASGAVDLNKPTDAIGLKMQGDVDLGILQDADRDIYSSGNVLLDATVHGALKKPLVNGRVELKNANINYAALPNGLSNGNGVILLNGTNATIQSLTGQSGGGKITLTGFAGLTPDTAVFNLHAVASRVRTRYDSISLTTSSDITLAGNANRSVLNGAVTVQRIAYSSSSDVGSILTSASAPPSVPSAPSPFLSGMRLDVRIMTAPDLRVITTYTQKLSLTSTLNLRGTAQDPGMLGRLDVTNGQLVFFGNTYTVNTGAISFYNPNLIQPILNLSLETIAQGVDVTLGVTGPVNNLKLTYRSDPPLTFEQIVQLLATNTTPSDPTIAANEPTPPQQTTSQMGESAVLGAAVASPLASRVKRLFGLTQFAIDPSISGPNGQPGAKVTLQQKIADNLTFTYINDVTQTNSEIVRVEYDITPTLSAVALRDFNGNVSVELFYKFHKR